MYKMDYGNLKVPENVTPEVQAILDSYEARNKEIENAHRKNTGRIWLGSAISGSSAHPVFNIPYVGTGLGGALYELGQGITEGDKLPELAKRTGTGFAIGETVGAIPYAGKYANKLSGGKIGNVLTAGVEKLANTPLGQKVAEIAPKVEDLLMTDIKAFNPNKQTVYHGSPADFNKFDNAYIGTGEGAQAHGYGHYSALNKDVADRYREGLSLRKGTATYKGKEITDDYKAEIQNIREFGKEGYLNRLNENLANKQQRLKDFEDMLENETDLSYFEDLYGFSNGEKHYQDYLDRRMNIANNIIPNIKKDINGIKFSIGRTNGINESDIRGGQLYKLSIPKDDVMLREDLLLSQQPKFVQQAFKDEIASFKKGLEEELQSNIDAKNILLESLQNAKAKGSDRLIYTIEKDIERNLPVYDTKIWQLQDQLNQNVPAAMNKTGQTIYDELGENASKILSNKGIKGISYNGGIDGEARVIFNPDDIDIVRKYYNQPSLYELIKKQKPFYGGVSNALYDYITGE
jgi:hypothetical protein